MDLDYNVIDDAIISALLPLKSEGVRTIATYAGQLDREAAEMTTLFPAIYLAFSGADFRRENYVYAVTLTYTFICCARNLRSHGKAVDGALNLLTMLRRAINNKFLVKRFTPFEVVSERVLFYVPNAGIAVCGAKYQTTGKIGG